MGDAPVLTRELKITAELGFPTQAYFGMLDWLSKSGYTVKKTDDWLYINPKTALHAEVMQRRQAIEQRLTQVMINVGDLRRDIELLKHDLRKFEGALEHHRKNELDVLKSDFVDFIDANTPSPMFKLAREGRFPTILIDFFRVKSEKDIEKLKVSRSEKSILEIKWKLFQQWRESFAKAVEDRVRVLREEINSRTASLENYKASIRPYLESIHKMRISEHTPPDVLSSPAIIEGYITSVAGVELVAWRGVTLPGRELYPEARRYKTEEGRAIEKEYPFYVYFEVTIRRQQTVIKGKEIEGMKVTLKSYLKTAEEISEKERWIKEREEEMLRSLEEFRGEREVAKPKEEVKAEPTALRKLGRIALVAPAKVAKEYMRGALTGGEGDVEDVLKKVVKEQAIAFYDALKELIGGLKLQRYPHAG